MDSRLELSVEATKSLSGKHAARKIIILYKSDGSKLLIDKPTNQGERGTYKRGIAGKVEVIPDDIEYVVEAYLVLNPQGRLKGWFNVYDKNGRSLLYAILRKRKIRRSRGDKSLFWLVEDAVRLLGLENYIRRYNPNTGAV